MRRLAAGFAAIGFALASCRSPPPPPQAAPAPLPPAVDVGLNEVRALSLGGGALWIATSAGVLRLDPTTLRHRLFEGDAATSLRDAADVDAQDDGSAWTAHRALGTAAEGRSPDGPRAGGVRHVRADGTWDAWFSEHGLGSDDVASVAAAGGLVAAVAGDALVLRRDEGTFAPVDADPRRQVVVVDAETGAERSVTEFRPKAERATALASDARRLVVGTTHGIQVFDGARRMRFDVPCRDARGAPRVVAVAPAGSGVAASLAIPSDDGSWRPGGAVLLRLPGAACLVPGIDVPDAPALDVGSDGRVTWLATYEGLLRIEGADVALLERGHELPAEAPTAVEPDGAGGCWAGTWGGGLLHVGPDGVRAWRIERGGGLTRRDAAPRE